MGASQEEPCASLLVLEKSLLPGTQGPIVADLLRHNGQWLPESQG